MRYWLKTRPNSQSSKLMQFLQSSGSTWNVMNNEYKKEKTETTMDTSDETLRQII